MNAVVPRLATAMNSSTDPRVLQTFGMEGVSLAMWERALPDRLARTLDALDAMHLPQLFRQVTVRNVGSAVQAACDRAGASACAARLAVELETLVAHAVEVFASPVLKLRLDVSDGEPRPKWHVPATRGILLCTLRGPETEFGPVGHDGTPQSVHRMSRGAVGVFRGLLWPGPELAAIAHRSPPREVGGPRLLVRIDPLDDAGSC